MSAGARTRLAIVVWVGALCAAVGPARSAEGQPRSPARARQPSALVSYREALLSWLPPEADRPLLAVDVAGTSAAPAAAIALSAADHSVRRFAAMALEAAGKQADGARLRNLPPIADSPSATRALGQIRMTIRSVEAAMAASPRPRDGAALGAVRASLQNVQLALETSRGGARAEENAHRVLQGASLVAHHAADAGVPPGTILDACAESLRDIAATFRERAAPADPREGSAARRLR